MSPDDPTQYLHVYQHSGSGAGATVVVGLIRLVDHSSYVTYLAGRETVA
jgi:hypothetical protein